MLSSVKLQSFNTHESPTDSLAHTGWKIEYDKSILCQDTVKRVMSSSFETYMQNCYTPRFSAMLWTEAAPDVPNILWITWPPMHPHNNVFSTSGHIMLDLALWTKLSFLNSESFYYTVVLETPQLT
jgi:hypothetical protein